MAVNAGVRVIATTRNRDRFPSLKALGATSTEVEGPDLSKRLDEAKQIDAVLDLVGNSTILDSLALLRRGGHACLAGFLGGLASVLTSTHFYRCQVGCISASLEASSLGHQASLCQMSLCRRLQTILQLVISRQSPPVCFALRISKRHIKQWSQIKPMARWWWSSEQHSKLCLPFNSSVQNTVGK